jgi:hypothetical protein
LLIGAKDILMKLLVPHYKIGQQYFYYWPRDLLS